MAPSGARPSTGPEKRSALRAAQRRGGAVAGRWRPLARSLRGRDRRSEARGSLAFGGVGAMGGRRASYPLHGISKRGDVYLRTLLIHGARSVLRVAARHADPTATWLKRVQARRNANIAAVALANKHARVV